MKFESGLQENLKRILVDMTNILELIKVTSPPLTVYRASVLLAILYSASWNNRAFDYEMFIILLSDSIASFEMLAMGHKNIMCVWSVNVCRNDWHNHFEVNSDLAKRADTNFSYCCLYKVGFFDKFGAGVKVVH